MKYKYSIDCLWWWTDPYISLEKTRQKTNKHKSLLNKVGFRSFAVPTSLGYHWMKKVLFEEFYSLKLWSKSPVPISKDADGQEKNLSPIPGPLYSFVIKTLHHYVYLSMFVICLFTTTLTIIYDITIWSVKYTRKRQINCWLLSRTI